MQQAHEDNVGARKSLENLLLVLRLEIDLEHLSASRFDLLDLGPGRISCESSDAVLPVGSLQVSQDAPALVSGGSNNDNERSSFGFSDGHFVVWECSVYRNGRR